MRRISYLLIVSVMVCAAAGAGELRKVAPAGDDTSYVQVETLWTAAPADRAAAKDTTRNLHAWLKSEQVRRGVKEPLEIEVAEEDLAALEDGACEGCGHQPDRLRVGIAKETSAEFQFSDLKWGAMKKTDDGGRVWSAAVRSRNAFGLRVHFDLVLLEEGVELYLYNDVGEAYGPFTGMGPLDTGEFWSPMITGETAYVQLRVYGKAGNRKLRRSSFQVTGVGHVASGFGEAFTDAAAKSFCSYNESCVENVECANADSAVDAARAAVAHIQFVSGFYLYICSGGLVNNTANDQTPYFITANHCLDDDEMANTLEAYFQWWVPCGAECPSQWGNPADVPKVLGASVVATNTVSDYTLLKLSEPAPAGSAFLGWTSEPIAFTNNAMLYRISHPKGAPQAYSEHRVDTGAPQCGSWPRGERIYSRDVLGATEGGSSGSPVVNAEGQLVGQLSGACGFNLNDTCDAASNATVDGAFANYFDEVAEWLDPPSTGCQDADGDGHQAASCGGDDCNDGDASIHPGAVEPCDGVDNDCDGGIDEGCVECDADGDLFDGLQCTGGSDCDDTDPFVYPGAPESCDNSIDDDCDGQVNEGCPDCDVDDDGWISGDCGGNDCDDSRANVHPRATELCDGFDNDCDGTIDEGCNTCEDEDGDGYQAFSCGGSDCNDNNPLINPGADEVCDNGFDDDCDGLTDSFDPDCATCADKKEPCASDDDCCSGRCHPRKNVCL